MIRRARVRTVRCRERRCSMWSERLRLFAPWRALLGALLMSLIPPAASQAGVGIWTSGGPEAGTIRVLAIDPQTPSVLYAGTGHSGLLKSSTGGDFWTPINVGLIGPFGPDLSIESLAIDPQAPATLYAGTVTGASKSTDGGASWKQSRTGLPLGRVSALAV